VRPLLVDAREGPGNSRADGLARRLAAARTSGQPGGREDAQRLVSVLPAMDIQRAYHLHRDLLELQAADRAAGGNVLASSNIDSNPNHPEETIMAEKIEIRKSGEKFRFVVLNRSGKKLVQSGQFDDKQSAKRAASALAKAVSSAEIVDATKPAAAAAKSSARRSAMKR
jgi:hypothetical protein